MFKSRGRGREKNIIWKGKKVYFRTWGSKGRKEKGSSPYGKALRRDSKNFSRGGASIDDMSEIKGGGGEETRIFT